MDKMIQEYRDRPIVDMNVHLSNKVPLDYQMYEKTEVDEILDNHISVCDACAIVYEGEAEFHFNAEKFTVKKGELIMFEKEKEHKVLALKDTKFLLVKI